MGKPTGNNRAKPTDEHRHGLQDEANKPHTLAASFYRVRDNLKTTLTLNNKGPLPLEVKPTLFNQTGERLEITPVTVDANSFSVIDLREWVANQSQAFEQGSLQLFYRGNDLRLGAQVKIVDEAASLMFDEQLVEPAMMFMSSRLEAVWWLPEQSCQIELHFSNTTDLPLPVSVAVKGMKPEQNIPLQITLQPHETRVSRFTGFVELIEMLVNYRKPQAFRLSIKENLAHCLREEWFRSQPEDTHRQSSL